MFIAPHSTCADCGITIGRATQRLHPSEWESCYGRLENDVMVQRCWTHYQPIHTAKMAKIKEANPYAL